MSDFYYVNVMSGSTISPGLAFKGYDKKDEVECTAHQVLIEMGFSLAAPENCMCVVCWFLKS